MSQSSWRASDLQPYQIPNFLVDQQIQKVLQSLRKTTNKEVQIQLKFRTQRDLKKFTEIYEQQINEEDYEYLKSQSDRNPKQNKFKKCKDINQKDYQIRQLSFLSYHFLLIFMKIYEVKLKQLQIQYNYRFFIHKNQFKVYIPKGEKISSFFKNQIFQMKTKLNLYYCNNPQVVDKILYSPHFNTLLEKKSIAAEYHKRLNNVDVAIFYSNVHDRKQIIQIVNKNFLQHMTILNFRDKRINFEINPIIFKLISSHLVERIKKIQKQNQIKIQTNNQKCCILVHDRHECFTDAKDQILQSVKKMIVFRLDGKDMRTLFNKVIRNHKNFPYLRVKLSHRSFYCVLNYQTFQESQKNLYSFHELFKQYFQNLTQESKVTFYLKFGHYPQFLNFWSIISQDKNITLNNFNEFMINDGYEMSKAIIGVKSLGQMNVAKTRKQFFEIFLKLIFKTNKVQMLLNMVSLKLDNFQEILGFIKPSQYSAILSQSVYQAENLSKQENQSLLEQQHNSQSQIISTSISQSESTSTQNQPESGNRTSSFRQKERQRQKKPKHIQLSYEFKAPQIDPDQNTFWNNEIRQRKLEKLLIQKYPQTFAKLHFKAYKLTLKQKISSPPIEQFQKDRIYISTIIEKNNQISHHLIDLNELTRISAEVRDKTFFVFYKIDQKELYVPSYTIFLI